MLNLKKFIKLILCSLCLIHVVDATKPLVSALEGDNLANLAAIEATSYANSETILRAISEYQVDAKFKLCEIGHQSAAYTISLWEWSREPGAWLHKYAVDIRALTDVNSQYIQPRKIFLRDPQEKQKRSIVDESDSPNKDIVLTPIYLKPEISPLNEDIMPTIIRDCARKGWVFLKHYLQGFSEPHTSLRMQLKYTDGKYRVNVAARATEQIQYYIASSYLNGLISCETYSYIQRIDGSELVVDPQSIEVDIIREEQLDNPEFQAGPVGTNRNEWPAKLLLRVQYKMKSNSGESIAHIDPKLLDKQIRIPLFRDE